MPLFNGPNWDFGSLRRVYEAIERIAVDDLGLDVYPVQIEVITSEQMLDAYASVGLPLMYRHWTLVSVSHITRRYIARGCKVSPTRSSSIRTPASATSWRKTP